MTYSAQYSVKEPTLCSQIATRPRIPGSIASSVYIIWPSRPYLWSLQGAYIAIRYLSAPLCPYFLTTRDVELQ